MRQLFVDEECYFDKGFVEFLTRMEVLSFIEVEIKCINQADFFKVVLWFTHKYSISYANNVFISESLQHA